MNLITSTLAMGELPPITAMYDYVLGAGGLYIRAEDSRMSALVPVAEATLPGLDEVEPYARLKVERIPVKWLKSILIDGCARINREVLYQFRYQPEACEWHCRRPRQAVTSVSIVSEDTADAVVDLHSHNSMPTFFSGTDDSDEQGLRFYCVVGKLDTDRPEIACRVGVYGFHMRVRVETIFEGSGPYADTYDAERYAEVVESSEKMVSDRMGRIGDFSG